MTRSDSAELELMRASLLLDSDPAAAARRASAILVDFPRHAEATLLLATACRKAGDALEAAKLLESLASAHRDSPLLQLELGRAHAAAGQGAAASAAFRRALALEPGLADGWRELAAQLFTAGDTLAGDEAYAHYTRLTRDPPELSDAIVALAENRLDAAEAKLRQRLQQAPGDVVALRMLAEVATRRDDLPEAERRLSECLALAPGYAAARYELARVLHTLQRSAEVLPLVDRLLASQPDNIDYLSLKAQSLRLLVGRTADAIALMDLAVTKHPDEARAWLLYGHLLREVGEQPRAIDMYRRALAVRPGFGRAYSALADLKTFSFASDDIAAMQEQIGHSLATGPERTHLEFALGKALEDAGQFEESFKHYARGNALQRSTVSHNPEAVTVNTQRSKEIYTPRFFADRSGWGSPRRDPIFIVGLPRSGSTLLEQMLASHSQVEGTRELPDLPAVSHELMARAGPEGRSAYPASVGALAREDIEEFAALYLSRTQAHRSSSRPRFVDKMLLNFGHLGLIQLMFPQAAIIDARRHPLGCGFSCYRQFFSRGLGFTYDLTELGRYYRDYVELMAHFDAVLPGRVHRVYYERVVADPEGELRQLLDYCGLAFEPQCLRFYENPRVVQTISSEQVRRPIYADSVEQWRHYEPWLGPLKETLGDLVDRYPLPPPAAA